jgi:hypothetical protein
LLLVLGGSLAMTLRPKPEPLAAEAA